MNTEKEVKREFYDIGKIKSEIHYKNDKAEGVKTTWYANGQKMSEAYYENGNKTYEAVFINGETE